MTTSREIDPTQTPSDPDATPMQPPLSGTVDDDDDVDDERWDENEPPDRPLRATNETPDDFRLDEEKEVTDADLEDEDAEDADSK